LFGVTLPPPDATADLPADVQPLLTAYRRREAAFKSRLVPPKGATDAEQRLFGERVNIERVVFSLFERGDSAQVASMYALDADLDFRQPDFVDAMLRGLTQKWLAPYLNLVAGDLKLCRGDETGRRQLSRGACCARNAASTTGNAGLKTRERRGRPARAARSCSPSL
jgi:hypothetical protein